MLFGRHTLVITDQAGRKLARLRLTPSLQLGLVTLFVLLFAAGIAGIESWRSCAVRARVAATLDRRVSELSENFAQLTSDVGAVHVTLSETRTTLAHLHRRVGLYRTPELPPEPPTAASEAPKDKEALPARDRLGTLLAEAQRQATDGALLLEAWRDAERRLRHTPSIRPARTAWLTSSFGVRADPMLGHWVMHKGLDLGGPLGMLILAPADGVVVWTGLRGGYGQLVVIDHGWGLQTHFAHLSRALVERGEQVKRGEPIAEMGSTGRSTGPHLHYEVRQDGVPLDPRRFILD